MQLYLWPPSVPALLSGGNRLSSLRPLDACKRVNIQACVLTFIASWLQSFQQILHPPLLLFNLFFFFFSFSHRTKQRPTIKATSMPGNLKPWRPRRTGSDEPGRLHPQGGRGTETENENENEIEARHPLLRQLFLHLWIQV